MDFSKALQIIDNNFESILEIMKLRKDPKDIDRVRNLLLTVNVTIDYFVERENKELKIGVVYFPLCEDFSQELCEEFVTLKMGLYSCREWKEFVCNTLNRSRLEIPNHITKKELELAKDNHRYEKKLVDILSRSMEEHTNIGKTIIYSDNLARQYEEYKESNKSYNRKLSNKYWYLNKAITSFNQVKSDMCPLVLTPNNSEELYEFITEYGEKINMENIIIFPTRTADGRYTDYCSDTFQKPYFDDFVGSNSGLRNVLFFCFSKKPYRLRRLFDFKQRMKERIQLTDDDSLDFISFTYNESLILNGKQDYRHIKVEIGKEGDELQTDYEVLFDDLTNGLDRHVSRRNEMSLCITTPAVNIYNTKIVNETESDEHVLSEIFRINTNLWHKEVDVILHHFVYWEDVFVITGNDISDKLKGLFRDYLVTEHSAKSVGFGTFGDLRGYQNIDKNYYNDIKQSRILIVSFRNDYTESIFHKYPNSFDPFCINPNQKLLEINNYFFLRQYFDWGRYNYGKALRKILKSDFRTDQMKPDLKDYKRPIKKLPEDTRDEEMDRNSSRVPQLQVVFSDNSIRSFGRSEWMLYKHGSNEGIAPLSDLLDLYETFSNFSIQPLAPLVKSICKDFIDSEREKDTKNEKLFKEQSVYGLTRQEIDSDLQLWKILLMKKINSSSSRDVYDEIMSHFSERYKISFNSFKKWTDKDYGIPRARKMQKYLVEDYLGIKPPYINLIRRIKERTKNDTETITMSVRHFLNITLLNSSSAAFDGLTPENRDLLAINDPEDIKRIIDSVKEKINYELVKEIK